MDKNTGAMDKILRTFGIDPKPEVKQEPTKGDTSFDFSKQLDEAGIPVQSKIYVDATCNTCYGRGVKRLVIQDGETGVVFDDELERVVFQPNRRLVACDCVFKGYLKTLGKVMATPEEDRHLLIEDIKVFDGRDL